MLPKTFQTYIGNLPSIFCECDSNEMIIPQQHKYIDFLNVLFFNLSNVLIMHLPPQNPQHNYKI